MIFLGAAISTSFYCIVSVLLDYDFFKELSDEVRDEKEHIEK